ncbi:helix-turn-helix transcriptional regulator [Spirosoma aureum]|uniref:Helix-turn-helix transcriptional regulator n=1 Tax=Spirosoma aureum TaxID=2692134 RepID=A0A6G9AVV6_9BACT|nr:helix-turn-helix transcriptional regulator [Spirosoma aureum]QIP16540.1 helix-turn-helix transcriptional regulator [Spirosoma aureum]
MNKKMDLDSFDVYAYITTNHTTDADKGYILVDHLTYHDAAIRFPFRTFFYGIGLTYASGSSFEVGSRQYPMQQGSLITIGPGIVSQWKYDTPDIPADTILFRSELLTPLGNTSLWASLPFFLPGGNHVTVLDDENIDKVKGLFRVLKQFSDESDIVASLTYSLLLLVRKIHEREQGRQSPTLSAADQLVQEFHRLVAQEFLVKKEVAYYASRLHITPKYLSEVLLAQTGRSAKTIIEDTVFLEAQSLLRQTSMNVQEICYYLGYADTSYFTKAFRNRVGMTPLAYRRQ